MIFTLAAAAGTEVAQYVIGAILLLLALVLIVIILQQTGKENSLSGTISGNTETFFGKSGGNGKDRLLSRLTIVISVVFVILTVVLLILTSANAA